MNILKQKWDFLNSTLTVVPKKIRHLYCFGFSTLVFREVRSFRSNARLLNLNWHTAKSNAYRVTTNQKLLQCFPELLVTLEVVRKGDVIAVDFSDFHGFQVLMFAKQTKCGRALPVYFEILEYPIQKGSQNTFIIQAIKHFVRGVGFQPKLVFDRGFACPSIVQFLAKTKHLFVIRVKRRKSIVLKKESVLVCDLKRNDVCCTVYGKRLRIIISDTPKDSDPWYLVTNDTSSLRKKIVEEYYYRFEIEEFFRDAKRVLGLEWVRCQKTRSLTILLWFVMVGLWFLSSIEEKCDDRIHRSQWQLSRFRYVFEKMQQEIFLATESQFVGKWYG